ncbi:hypothetical protein Len3610_15395 [Lentibacillus sp. CBA3610]|nr:hypothetical protein Len3610_15395 [Lentibacillus sp. CBA3610]
MAVLEGGVILFFVLKGFMKFRIVHVIMLHFW